MKCVKDILVERINKANAKIKNANYKQSCKKCSLYYDISPTKFLCLDENVYDKEYAIFGFNKNIISKNKVLDICPKIK